MPATWTATLWLEDVEKVDHETLGLARLIWQYRGDQTRIQGWLGAYLAGIQSVEDVSFEVLAGVWPLTAVGVQLDTLGEIVGQPRGALSDDQYRIMILGRIFVNFSDGRLPEALDMLDSVFCIAADSIACEHYPCEVVLDVVEATYGDLIGDLANDWAAGGVDLLWVWNDQAEADCFAMGDTLGIDETNATGGFGDLTGATQTTGGYMSGSQT